MKPHQQRLGKRGETVACNYLRQHGYQIVATNWHCRAGELDIIAEKGGRLHFVEVRSRFAESTEGAFESVGGRKQQRVVQAVYAYLEAKGLEDADWQIDVAGVAFGRGRPPLVEYVENALEW